MKTIFFLLLLGGFFLDSNDLSAQKINNDEAAIKKLWKDAWVAYETADEATLWSLYSDEIEEIGPDGYLISGKAAIKESWDAMNKMVDRKPTFTYNDPVVRLITNDVALITWDSSSDVLVGGRQVGGPTKGMAVVKKTKGKWLIEFDALVPVVSQPMPVNN